MRRKSLVAGLSSALKKLIQLLKGAATQKGCGTILNKSKMKIYYRDIAKETYYIDFRDRAVLSLCFLHFNGKITNHQLSLYLSRYEKLRDEKNPFSYELCRRVNTYHSRINDEWYTDESFDDILHHICETTCDKLEMTFDEILKTLNIGFNKRKNWCVNYLGLKIIHPLISIVDVDKTYKILHKMGFDFDYVSYEEADRKYNLSSGYCCDDCSGCYSNYKRNEYYSRYRLDREKVKSLVLEKLLSYKTHSKNPSDRLIWEF